MIGFCWIYLLVKENIGVFELLELEVTLLILLFPSETVLFYPGVLGLLNMLIVEAIPKPILINEGIVVTSLRCS